MAHFSKWRVARAARRTIKIEVVARMGSDWDPSKSFLSVARSQRDTVSPVGIEGAEMWGVFREAYTLGNVCTLNNVLYENPVLLLLRVVHLFKFIVSVVVIVIVVVLVIVLVIP